MRSPPDWTRREFVEVTGAAAGAALASGLVSSLPAAAETPAGFRSFREPGRVVQVVDERALPRMYGFPRAQAVREMVARAVCALTGMRTPRDAWAALIHPRDVVGIKPNCLAGRYMSTHKEVVEAVVQGVLSVGVPPGNIVVWEQQTSILRSGRMRPRDEEDEVRYVAIMTRYGRGHFGPLSRHGAGSSRYAEVVHRASAIINLPVFKDHSIAGITVAMKNLTHGTIDNPFRYHHRNHGEIAHIYAHPLLAPKVRLTLADALRVQYDGGPHDSPRKVLHGSLYASTDPVAIDATALRLIEELRRKKGLRSLEKAGRAATHVQTAEELGLGIADESRIRIERLRLG